MSLVKVSKSNFLVEASYHLTLQEQRLILVCLAKLDSRGDVPKETIILASDYAQLMKIDIKNAHRELYKAAEKLYNRSIVVSDPKKTEEFRWIQKKAIYHQGEGRVTLTWSDDVLIYISQLKQRFTTYRLSDVADLGSTYAIRLYELLMQFNTTKERKISLIKFKSLFNLEDKYLLFRDLNKRVIKPAVKEINQSSNLIVFYNVIKEGRSVVSLQFDFEEKKQRSFSFGNF